MVEMISDNVPRKLFRPNEEEVRMIARLGDQMIRDKLLEAAMRRRDGEVFSITPEAENKALHVYDVMMSAMLDMLFAELADGSLRRDRMRRVIESII